MLLEYVRSLQKLSIINRGNLMLAKKLVTLATLGMASVGVTSTAFAGGPDYVSTPGYAGIYLEGNLGYTYRPWRKDVTTFLGNLKQFGVLKSSSRGDGGSIFGADVGYQFNQYFALEGGLYYLPEVKFTAVRELSKPPVSPVSFTIKSGTAYAALKGMAPIYENTYVFGKLGVAYTYNQANPPLLAISKVLRPASHSNYWNPLFASGVQYYFTPDWSVNAQYTFVPGYRNASSSRFVAPVTNLFTVGVGYKFLM